MAAEQGHAGAQGNLGTSYFEGKGVPQDYTEAVVWYRKAAAQGYVWAQNRLGAIYGKGEGVSQNYVLANMWFTLSAGQGDETGKQGLDLIASLMTPDQIAEAERLAAEWMEKHQQ
jgi:TPR repeat protein